MEPLPSYKGKHQRGNRSRGLAGGSLDAPGQAWNHHCIMARIIGYCWKCGTAWEGDSQPGRAETCAQCSRDIRSCRNCQHHDPTYHNECRIPNTEMIRDRDRSNFCDEFELSKKKPATSSISPVDEARRKLDALFGGGKKN